MKAKWREDRSVLTGEKVNLYKVTCKCGHVLNFISNHKVICNHCGRLVYASKKSEFKDKLLKEINKK